VFFAGDLHPSFRFSCRNCLGMSLSAACGPGRRLVPEDLVEVTLEATLLPVTELCWPHDKPCLLLLLSSAWTLLEIRTAEAAGSAAMAASLDPHRLTSSPGALVSPTDGASLPSC